MSTIKIHTARAKDIEGIYSLVEELAVYEKARHEMTLTLEDYKLHFKNKDFNSIVALLDNEVVGTCIYYDTFSTWKGRMLYLEDFVVKSSKRQLGIGQILFDHLIDIGRNERYALVKWQVLDWNDPAVRFYEKNKATIEREWWNCKVVF